MKVFHAQTRCVSVVFGLFALSLSGRAPANTPLISAAPRQGEVKVDGRLDEPAWRYTVTGGGLAQLDTRNPAPRETTFKLIYDAEALYLGVECHTVTGGKRLMLKPTAKERDAPVFSDESIEFYLQPTKAGSYFHFAVNSLGTQYDGRGFDSSWNAEWTARTAESELGWQLEMRLPFKSLGVSAPKPGEVWRCNLCRNDRTYQQYLTWAELSRGFHEPENFGELLFTDRAIGCGARVVARHGEDIEAKVEVQSGAESAVTLRGCFTIQTPQGRWDLEKNLSLSPKEAGLLSAIAKDAWRRGASVWISHTLSAGEVTLYRSPPLMIAADKIRPTRPSQPVALVIQNQEVALTFDESSGNLLSATNKQTGMTIAFGESGTSVLELDAVRYINNPRYFRPEDVQTLRASIETLVSCRKESDASGERVMMEHRFEPDIKVLLSILVPRTGTETEWQIKLDNPLTYQPSKALVLHRVRYPYFTDIAEDACGSDPFVILPTLMGQKIPAPGKNLVGHRPIPYIGAATMGWFDFYGSRGGLYFKVGDLDPLPQTSLIAFSDSNTGKLNFGIERWSLTWPGEKWSPGPCGVAIHAGDWHQAADLYRAWFRKNFKPMDPPQWLKEADGYVMTGGPTYEFADFPRIIENAKARGINYIQLWSEMTGGDITYHAFFFPNPYMGTEDELKRAIAEMHKRGGHIGFYLNFNTGDPLLGTFVQQPQNAQKIPKQIPRPPLDYMKDNWIQQSIMSPAGSYSTWNVVVPGYLDGYWNTCPAADKWTSYYHYWVTQKWAKEYKADVWYLDSCPVSRGAPCFAFDHGHARPAPEGQSIIDFYKRLRADLPKDFCLMQEYSSDRLLPYSTHALGLMWHPAFPHPEVLRYTLPEYTLFSGMCNGWERVSQFYPGERVEFRDAIERVFLIGNRYELGISNRPPAMINKWEKQMVDLRRACRPEMNYGDFLDDIGLGTLPARVYARLFRRADRGRLAVTLLDRRQEKRTPFTLSLNLAAAGVGAPRNVRLVTLEGEQSLPTPSVENGCIAIEVPVFPPRTAALLIEVSR